MNEIVTINRLCSDILIVLTTFLVMREREKERGGGRTDREIEMISLGNDVKAYLRNHAPDISD